MRASLFVLLSVGAFAQQPTAPPAFEVASIKPSKEIDPRGGLLNPVGNRVTWTNADLGYMITFAYNVPGIQLVGGPNWVRSEKYDVVAKAEGDGKRTTDEFRQMFQSLLAERFKLALHREIRDVSVYALLPGKNGPKHLEPKIEEKAGDGYRRFRGGPRHLAALKMSMTQLAQFLQPEMRAMVLDETGITGEYSFKLDYDSVDGQERVPPGFPESGTSLYTALQEQLGLKLESVKRPVEHLVIDYAEKPTGN
jgi:uncharacterized protein (TIGR03435 family)